MVELRQFLSHVAAALAVAPLGAPALAETVSDTMDDAGPQDRTILTLEDFARFAPRTALDMVQRVPGVSISKDDSDSRGFGQASGNVLINGQRVSGKSNGASAALGRVPARQVERIEVADASVFGVPGLSGQAINVVTSGEARQSGSWKMQARWRDDFQPSLGVANLALSGRSGDVSWSVEADNAPERRGNQGFRNVTDGTGNPLELRQEKFTFYVDTTSLSGSMAWKPPGGMVANLNGKAATYRQEIKDRAQVFPVAGPEGRRLFESLEDQWNAELGGDVGFDLGPGRLKAIGLARRERSPFNDTFLRGGLDGSDLYRSDFRQTTDAGEYILRSEYGWKTPSGPEWQLSAEGAFNFLEAESELSEAISNGPFMAVPLDTSNTRVEERRAEAMLTHTRSLATDLTMQLAVGAEYSEISQSGDTQKVRTFTRPKGYASVTWATSETLSLVTRIERKVGQLDFFDFVTSADLSLDNNNAGNPDIVPTQVWSASLQAEKGFSEWGAATAKITYDKVEDIVDRVPIGAGDGPGNIDTAWGAIAELDATLKLAPLGFEGAEVTARGVWIDSRLDDPVTGASRRISDDLLYEVNVEFRYDVPGTQFAWGSKLERVAFTHEFTRSERRLERQLHGMGDVFVEHKDLWGATGRFAVRNFLDHRDVVERTVFAPDRNGLAVRREVSERDRGLIFVLSLNGTF